VHIRFFLILEVPKDPKPSKQTPKTLKKGKTPIPSIPIAIATLALGLLGDPPGDLLYRGAARGPDPDLGGRGPDLKNGRFWVSRDPFLGSAGPQNCPRTFLDVLEVPGTCF
jgi:hypothetical protein